MGEIEVFCYSSLFTMSDIKLSYFNARGRAETARLILAHAGVRYIDQRLTGDQFASVKSRLPYGQLPSLKYDGEVICTSMAIARWGLSSHSDTVIASCLLQVPGGQVWSGWQHQ